MPLADATQSVALLGPTNTGKTHRAVERMLEHDSGMIGLPLRLLAREVDYLVATDAISMGLNLDLAPCSSLFHFRGASPCFARSSRTPSCHPSGALCSIPNSSRRRPG